MQGKGLDADAENVCGDQPCALSGMCSCSNAPAPSWLAERRRRPSLPAHRTCTALGYLMCRLLHAGCQYFPHADCLYSACKAVKVNRLGRSTVRCLCAVLTLHTNPCGGTLRYALATMRAEGNEAQPLCMASMSKLRWRFSFPWKNMRPNSPGALPASAAGSSCPRHLQVTAS